MVVAGGGLHLAGVPGPADQAAAVLAVVLRHPQPVRPLDVEADLVLGVEPAGGAANHALEHALVRPETMTIYFPPSMK